MQEMQEMQASAWVIKIIPLLSIWHIYVNLAFQLSLLCLNTFKGMQKTQIACWNINSERNNLFGVSLILHLYFINGQLYISSVGRVQGYLGFPTGSVLYFRYMDLPCGCALGGFPMWNSLVFPATWFCHVLRGRHREIGLHSIFLPFLVTHVFLSRVSGG